MLRNGNIIYIHHVILARASKDLGLLYQGAYRQLFGIQINEPNILIQVNLNLSSDTELNLITIMDSSSNQIQRDNLYSHLLLLFLVNLNCLRPQTGYIHILLNQIISPRLCKCTKGALNFPYTKNFKKS